MLMYEPPNRMKQTPLGSIGKYTSLALLLPLSTFIGYWMGYGLDYYLHLHWLRWVFLVLGTISGFISLLRELDADQ